MTFVDVNGQVKNLIKMNFIMLPKKAVEVGLTPHELATYVRILYRGTCFEKQGKMAQGLGMSRRQLSRCIGALRSKGLIVIEERFGKDNLQKASLIYAIDPDEWVELVVPKDRIPGETHRHSVSSGETGRHSVGETHSLTSNYIPSNSSFNNNDHTSYDLSPATFSELQDWPPILEPLGSEEMSSVTRTGVALETPTVSVALKPNVAPKPEKPRKLKSQCTPEEVMAGEHVKKVLIPLEVQQVAKDWEAFTCAEMPHLATRIKNYGEALMLVSRRTGLNATGLKALFEFISQDSFWSQQCYSPHGLLKVSKSNGLRKVDNILAAMKKDRGTILRQIRKSTSDVEIDF